MLVCENNEADRNVVARVSELLQLNRLFFEPQASFAVNCLTTEALGEVVRLCDRRSLNFVGGFAI